MPRRTGRSRTNLSRTALSSTSQARTAQSRTAGAVSTRGPATAPEAPYGPRRPTVSSPYGSRPLRIRPRTDPRPPYGSEPYGSGQYEPDEDPGPGGGDPSWSGNGRRSWRAAQARPQAVPQAAAAAYGPGHPGAHRRVPASGSAFPSGRRWPRPAAGRSPRSWPNGPGTTTWARW